jgi:hypothetical protein
MHNVVLRLICVAQNSRRSGSPLGALFFSANLRQMWADWAAVSRKPTLSTRLEPNQGRVRAAMGMESWPSSVGAE